MDFLPELMGGRTTILAVKSMEARHEQARTALDLAAVASGPEPAS